MDRFSGGTSDQIDTVETLCETAEGDAATATRTRYLTKSIEDIAVGDQVLAKGENDPFAEPAMFTVDEVYRRTSDHLRVLTIRESEGNEQTLKTTDDHPFYIVDSATGEAGWINASKLVEGDRLLQPDGSHTTVVQAEREEHPEGVPVFNFRVAEAHTYFVREEDAFTGEPVWVHNATYSHSPEFFAKRAAYKKYVTRQAAKGKKPMKIGEWSTVHGYDAGTKTHRMNVRNARVGQEIHHFATNKHAVYAPQMEAIANRYGLKLDGDWNKKLLPHRGRHTHTYHDFTLGRMQQADRLARGDVGEFLNQYEKLVIDPVIADPTILYR